MTELAREYGDGLYALAVEEGQDTPWLDQLKILRTCFAEQQDFLRLLSNMSLSKEERLSILDETLKGQIHPYLLNFLKILCEHGAMMEFSGCEEAYRLLYNRDHGIVEAVVTTAVPLSDTQRTALQQRLKEMTGKQVTLSEKIDASVMGGVMLEMNGKRYDNTVAHKLADLRRIIAGED